MKRFAVALPVVVAWVLFCLPALAGDAAILPEPEPMPVKEAHWLLALGGVLIAAVRTALSNDTVKLPTAAAPLRAIIVTGLAAAGMFVEQLIDGFALKSALLTLVMLGLPSLVQEILKYAFGASKNAGGGKAMFPPAML
jgi:hypothetical protein